MFYEDNRIFVISDFRRDVDENCALLGCYAALRGSSVTDISGQPIGPVFKNMGKIRCRETSVNNYHSTLRNIPEERSSHDRICPNTSGVLLVQKKRIICCNGLVGHIYLWAPMLCILSLHGSCASVFDTTCRNVHELTLQIMKPNITALIN
jgi:hypothetical protein